MFWLLLVGLLLIGLWVYSRIVAADLKKNGIEVTAKVIEPQADNLKTFGNMMDIALYRDVEYYIDGQTLTEKL